MPTPTIDVRKILGPDADALLNHECKTVSKSAIHCPGPDFVDRVIAMTDRNANVLRNYQLILKIGRAHI